MCVCYIDSPVNYVLDVCGHGCHLASMIECVCCIDSGELSLGTPRFVRDTSQLWHRPNISREEGIVTAVAYCSSTLSAAVVRLFS